MSGSPRAASFLDPNRVPQPELSDNQRMKTCRNVSALFPCRRFKQESAEGGKRNDNVKYFIFPTWWFCRVEARPHFPEKHEETMGVIA